MLSLVQLCRIAAHELYGRSLWLPLVCWNTSEAESRSLFEYLVYCYSLFKIEYIWFEVIQGVGYL